MSDGNETGADKRSGNELDILTDSALSKGIFHQAGYSQQFLQKVCMPQEKKV